MNKKLGTIKREHFFAPGEGLKEEIFELDPDG
jgi:hypothetical protein